MSDESVISMPRILAEAVLTDFIYAKGSDFSAETYPAMDRLRTMVRSDSESVAHKPGESHHYVIFCKICGGFGQVNLSVEPRFAEDPAHA